MGVKGLFPFLRQNAPGCFSQPSVGALKGKRIVIDGSLLLFREFTSPWLGVKQPHKTVLWCLRLVRLCRQHDILPIIVFDSPQTTPAKARERAKRTITREASKTRLRETKQLYGRLEELEATMMRMRSLTTADQTRVKVTFNTMKTNLRGTVAEKAETALPKEICERSERAPIDVSSSIGEVGAKEDEEELYIPSEVDSPPKAHSCKGDEVTFEVPAVYTASEKSSTNEIIALAQRLLIHRETISHDAAYKEHSEEFSLLSKIVDPNQLDLPVEEFYELQSSTAGLVDKLQRRLIFPTYADFRTACKYLLRFGIPAQMSPDWFEGECTASYLVREGLADYVATEDSDVLVYGVPQLRGFLSVHHSAHEAEPCLGEMKLVNPSIMRHELAMHHKQSTSMSESSFLDFALLCGTDFTSSIAGFGVTKAASAICAEETIERMMPLVTEVKLKSGQKRGKSRYTIHPQFYTDIEIAREIFSTFPIDHDMISADLKSIESIRESETRFRRLCHDSSQWDKIEQDIIAEEGIDQSDVALVDQPGLYLQQNRSREPQMNTFSQSLLKDRPGSGSDQEPNHGGLVFRPGRMSN